MTDIVIFEATSGLIDVRLEKDNVWLSLAQLVTLFGRVRYLIRLADDDERTLRQVFQERALRDEGQVEAFLEHRLARLQPSELFFETFAQFRPQSR